MLLFVILGVKGRDVDYLKLSLIKPYFSFFMLMHVDRIQDNAPKYSVHIFRSLD